MYNGHTGGVGVLSTVEKLSLSQRLLMYNGHTSIYSGVFSINSCILKRRKLCGSFIVHFSG